MRAVAGDGYDPNGDGRLLDEFVEQWRGNACDTILFVDCEAAFYRTSYTRAFAQLLQAAGVEFGLMREPTRPS